MVRAPPLASSWRPFASSPSWCSRRPGWRCGPTIATTCAIRDRFDDFWGARIVMSFTRAHIEAAVAQARYDDSRTARYITRTLIARQRKLGRYFFSKVNPLDDFRLVADQICFRDLLISHDLASPNEATSTRYVVRSYDYAGSSRGARRTIAATRDGRVCTPYRAGSSHDAYTIVELVTTRAGKTYAAVEAHLAQRNGRMHLIGIYRR